MPANTRVCAGFRSASRVVSESGRDGSATAIVAAVELLALSKAFAPETSATTAIKIATIFISILLRNASVLADFSTKYPPPDKQSKHAAGPEKIPGYSPYSKNNN